MVKSYEFFEKMLRKGLILGLVAISISLTSVTVFTDVFGGLAATIGGTQGTGNGEFDQPWGLGVNSTGHIFVVEYYNQRISLFDETSNHTFESLIVEPSIRYGSCSSRGGGSDCSANGKLNGPSDVDIDSSGNLWVVDTGNHRIQKFDDEGTYLSKFGTYGTGDGEFYSPTSIAIDSSDNIWVADMNNDRIQKFNSAGVFQLKFGSGDCSVIQSDGTVTDEADNGKFCDAVAIDVDSSDNLYVVDHNNRRIQKFDSSGNYLTKFGSYGTTDGKFKNPYFITIDKYGSIYVGDRERNNVQVFDDNFNFRYAITGLSDPKDIVVDSFDRLLVAYNHAVNVYTSTSATFNKATTTSLDFSTYYDVHITNMTNVLTSITIPSSNSAASLNFTRALYTTPSTGDKSIVFENRIVINATTTQGDVDVIIPTGLKVNGTSSWDGKLKLASYAPTSDISLSNQVVDLNKKFGSDDVNLTFSAPVKMTFTGKSDKNVGVEFVNGTERLISTECVADDLTQVTTQLSSSTTGDCKITSGSDLIVYTKHFTSFFTSSTSSSSSSSSGGGKSSCDSNGFGMGQSLKIYRIKYDIETNDVEVLAYSTCGAINAKIVTAGTQKILGLSMDQPYLDEQKTVYNGKISPDDTKFTILVENKRDSFDETFYVTDSSIIREYGTGTGYTSEQQGMMYEKQSKVPEWVKNNAKWWSDSQVDDTTFSQGIGYLIKENIIEIDNLPSSSGDSDQSVPEWVKNNAKWWADGMISEDDFLRGITYMVEKGIIQIK